MEKICAVFDYDEQYARRLMNAMNSRKGVNYRTIMFTEESALGEYMADRQLPLLVVGEEAMEQITDTQRVNRVVVLREDSGTAGTYSNEKVSEVYKYQQADSLIYSIVGDEVSRIYTYADDRKVIGIYSPIHYAGKTSFALALASACAKSQERVLYVNMEEFSGLSELLPDCGEGNMSDALYTYRTNRAAFANALEKIVGRTGDVYYIPPIRCADDITCQTAEEWQDFITDIASSGLYDTIILDIGTLVSEPWRVLEVCTRAIMPVREDYISMQKLNDFETYMLSMGREHVCGIIEKMLLPKDNGMVLDKGYLDAAEYGTLGRHAREVVKSWQ